MTLLGMRYKLGGRGEDGTIDCYGVTIAKARELGRELPDVWLQVCRQWTDGGDLDLANGFPEGWRRLRGPELARAIARPLDGDVWLTHAAGHQGVGIIAGGRFWTATPDAGVVALRPGLVQQPEEVWRR